MNYNFFHNFDVSNKNSIFVPNNYKSISVLIEINYISLDYFDKM